MSFSILENNILRVKGLTDEHLQQLTGLGILSKDDFQTIGTFATLLELLPDLDPETARRVMDWALPTATPSPAAFAPEARHDREGPLVINSSDSVYCVHCHFKQPKDYTPGDLCPNCGLQAEPIETCYWCGSSGPGRYCRVCGAAFVGTAELPLAMILRRDGVARDDIPPRLQSMTPGEKEALWGRVRRARQ